MDLPSTDNRNYLILNLPSYIHFSCILSAVLRKKNIKSPITKTSEGSGSNMHAIMTQRMEHICVSGTLVVHK